MPKRPTPKQRRAKSKGKAQYSVYEQKQIKRLTDRQNSPYAKKMEPKGKAEKALEGITRIKA